MHNLNNRQGTVAPLDPFWQFQRPSVVVFHLVLAAEGGKAKIAEGIQGVVHASAGSRFMRRRANFAAVQCRCSHVVCGEITATLPASVVQFMVSVKGSKPAITAVRRPRRKIHHPVKQFCELRRCRNMNTRDQGSCYDFISVLSKRNCCTRTENPVQVLLQVCCQQSNLFEQHDDTVAYSDRRASERRQRAGKQALCIAR